MYTRCVRRQMSNGITWRPDISTCRKPLCLQLLNKGEQLPQCAAGSRADAQGILLGAEYWTGTCRTDKGAKQWVQ